MESGAIVCENLHFKFYRSSEDVTSYVSLKRYTKESYRSIAVNLK